MASSLENLRDWIDQSPHLKNIRQDDQVFHPTFYNHALSCRTSHVMKHSRSWSSFYVVASLALRGPRRSWTTSTWSKEPCLSGLTGCKMTLLYMPWHRANISSSGKKVGPLWAWGRRITKARSLFASTRLWWPGVRRISTTKRLSPESRDYSLGHSVRMRLGFCPAEPRNWKWPNSVGNS